MSQKRKLAYTLTTVSFFALLNYEYEMFVGNPCVIPLSKYEGEIYHISKSKISSFTRELLFQLSTSY
jgi:hypothetical protein